MDLFEWVWENFADVVKEVLPTSPFRQFLDDFANLPFLNYLNWFVPVKEILIVLVAWCGAIALFFLYSIIMRWLKVIGD